MNYQPVLSDVADLYWWKTTQNLTSITLGAVGNYGTDQVKIKPDAFFVHCAWRGATNYDGAVQLRAVIGAGPAAATALYTPNVPNNFEVMVKRNNRFQMMDQPMPQAAICSTGYRAGQQVPIPIIYPPLTMFNFELWNVAPVQFTLANQSTALNLRVDFGLFGYNVPKDNLGIFIGAWPEYYGRAMRELTQLKDA